MESSQDNRISVVIQGVEFFQDEMDTNAKLRAFNNVVMLDSESIKLDDRRIDTQIRRNGWADILVQLINGPAPVETDDEVEQTEEVEDTEDSTDS
jgi:hypothetical protein